MDCLKARQDVAAERSRTLRELDWHLQLGGAIGEGQGKRKTQSEDNAEALRFALEEEEFTSQS